MSCTLIVIGGLPAAAAAWPVVCAAAAAAATSLGYSQVAGETEGSVRSTTKVDLEVRGAGEIADGLLAGQEMVFARGDVKIVFSRDNRGKSSVCVHGDSHSKDELRALGDEFANKIVQEYAYHRLVTEMKNRSYNIVEEDVEEDGTVRMQVRIFRGGA